MRKIAHTGAWVKRTVEGEQSACQGEKAWRINTGVENFCGWKGGGTQRGGGQGGGGKAKGGRRAMGLPGEKSVKNQHRCGEFRRREGGRAPAGRGPGAR